jgi:signal transduction histidine kinase
LLEKTEQLAALLLSIAFHWANMGSIQTITDKYFIHQSVKDDPVMIGRARMLIWLLFIWIITGVTLSVFHKLQVEQIQFPLIKVIFIGLTGLFSFKAFGNFDLTSNILAAGIASILIPLIWQSGGLYSDNLLWLVFCPFVVALFGNKRFDILWYLGVVAYFLVEYQRAVTNPNLNLATLLASFTPDYFFVSYLAFVTVVSIMVWMFKYGNTAIVNKLKQNQQSLESKHQELLITNKRLQDTTSALTRSNKDLEAFASIASHDLKEPLRMIAMYTQLLRKNMGSSMNSDETEYMGYILDGTNHMQRLLDDILDYSRVGRSQERVRLIDMDDVVYYVQKLMAATIFESKAQITIVDPLPEVHGRYSELVQVVQNLLSNAIKFRKKDVDLVITVRYIREEDSHLISFADNGIGMDQRYAHKVFQMFERLHTKAEYNGTGIGLALCNKVIGQIGGQIWLDSEVGIGTKVYIRLPLEPVLVRHEI